MKLRGYGEDRLVRELTHDLPRGPEVQAGAGEDDCAVIGEAGAERWHLLKTDAVLEGVHFLRSDAPRRVGWKALCRALSDIAAMGGVPEHALITVAIDPEEDVARVQELYRGLRDAAERFAVLIVGGETARSPGGLFINVALTGWVERRRCVLRSTGRPGDLLYVTGQLGGSRAGRHLDFVPRLAQGRWLARRFRPTAMIDLSDGLEIDGHRLAQSSGCGFSLDRKSVPRSQGATLAQALGDGEDFELLFALAAEKAARLETAWSRAFPELPLTRIGRLTSPLAASRRQAARKRQVHLPHGFDHFA